MTLFGNFNHLWMSNPNQNDPVFLFLVPTTLSLLFGPQAVA